MHSRPLIGMFIVPNQLSYNCTQFLNGSNREQLHKATMTKEGNNE